MCVCVCYYQLCTFCYNPCKIPRKPASIAKTVWPRLSLLMTVCLKKSLGRAVYVWVFMLGLCLSVCVWSAGTGRDLCLVCIHTVCSWESDHKMTRAKQNCLHSSTHTLLIPEENLQLTLDCLRHTASLRRKYTAWSRVPAREYLPLSCVTVNYEPLPGYDSAFAYSSTFCFVQMAAMLS